MKSARDEFDALLQQAAALESTSEAAIAPLRDMLHVQHGVESIHAGPVRSNNNNHALTPAWETNGLIGRPFRGLVMIPTLILYDFGIDTSTAFKWFFFRMRQSIVKKARTHCIDTTLIF